MADNRPLLYVDSAIFIAWIKGEVRIPGEMEGVRDLFKRIANNEVRIVTSVATETEVLDCNFEKPEDKRKWQDFLRRRNVIVVQTDTRIWKLAHEIRNYYQQRKAIDKLPTVELPDAVHLATAIQYKVERFYTFDQRDLKEKKRALIPLSPKIADKHPLIIEKPQALQTDAFTQAGINASPKQ